ncbi:unnamed protein product [Caenorhabditis angaria]|uniref:Uncharacterized protein n=1 Tax=Caenorhabditis angaria TaxID=860376 RepID=A0A9P1I9I2_9PELO|nr:unnamed protein product [Caenorhabditis angaria]
MDISDEELRKYSPSQLLEYTLKLRQDVRKNGHVYSYPYSKSWFDLPFEMREIVIDEMDVKTRSQEIKELFAFNRYFTLKFDEFDELKTTVICRPSDSRKKNMGWKTIEEGKPNDVLKKYLNNYLEIYRKSIKRFSLRDVADLESVKGVSIKNLRYLKEVYVDFSFDSLESLIECGFTDYKQILRIETVTFISLDKLELETILKFQGKYLTVDVADFVVRMNEFLIKCKNGEIHDNVEMFDFYYPTGLDNFSSLDHERIIQGLDIFKSEMNHFKHELSFRFASSAKKSGMINVLYYSSKIKVEFKKE